MHPSTDTKRIIMYYQTFISLKPILIKPPPITHIIVSSVHFGEDNGKPYIHLNNQLPNDSSFNTMWAELEKASSLGISVKIMIGGAGGGYSTLFSNFNLYYPLLVSLLNEKSFISGVDLDVEEECTLENVKFLIKQLKEEFGHALSLSMAPIQSSLENDEPGLGGFIYKELMRSPEGKCIDYFNVQFYSDYSCQAYDNIVENGYLPNMIVMGAEGGHKNDNELSKTAHKYKYKFGGVFVWEYCLANPSPIAWANDVNALMNEPYVYK